VLRRLVDYHAVTRPDVFATVLYAALDRVDRRLQLATLGHPLPLLIRDGRSVPLPLEYELALTLLPALRKSGCTTSLDVGFHPDWLRRPENLEICRTVDYFFPNEREAALICGGEGMDYLSFAQERGLVHPVLKRGQAGAAMIANGVKYESPSLPVSVIDTTGAGDVFDAGFIDAQLDALSPEICLRRACVCGALSTRAPGALSAIPDRIELERASELNHGA